MPKMKDVLKSYKELQDETEKSNANKEKNRPKETGSFSSLETLREALLKNIKTKKTPPTEEESPQPAKPETQSPIPPKEIKAPPEKEEKVEKTQFSAPQTFEKPPPTQKETKKREEEIIVFNGLNFYLDLHRKIGQILSDARNNFQINVTSILKVIPAMIDSIRTGEELFILAIQRKRYATWLASHMVNVAVISVKLGLGLKLSDTELHKLALSGFLHDIGMLKIPNRIIFKHGKLTEDEFEIVKRHPEYGLQYVSHLKDTMPYLINAIYQEHERYDGSGYPKGLRGDEISLFARIIGLADTFEALVHGRAYRDGFITQKAIQTIIQYRGKSFDPKVLKAMLNTISIFPVGSYVQLNTGEIAKVVSVNKQRPVRPIVEVVKDSNGNVINPPYRIDLEKEPLTYIVKQIS